MKAQKHVELVVNTQSRKCRIRKSNPKPEHYARIECQKPCQDSALELSHTYAFKSFKCDMNDSVELLDGSETNLSILIR